MLDLLADLVARAQRAGADAADALAVESRSVNVGFRVGKLEQLERSESEDLGLRVFVGKRQAIVSGTDRSPKALAALVERAVAMARVAPEDPLAGLADPGQIATEIPALDLHDPVEPPVDTLLEHARSAEAAALAVAGVTNSDGGNASWGEGRIALVASNGFAGSYARSSQSVSASAVAGTGTGMERDYDYTYAVYGSDLKDAAEIGRRAGERAVRRLNPRKVETCRVPVVFEQRLAASLVGHLAGAINGQSIARGTSFLKESMGKQILSRGIRVVDDPLRLRGFASRPFDGEGLATAARDIVTDGVLQTWFLDLQSARQLGLESTHHASRGVSGPPSPSPTNLDLMPGTLTPDELIADIENGLFVTEAIGMGVNLLTGDYSRGAAGFWIEKGRIAYPVSEITIAGTLQEMFRNLTPANDLIRKSSVNAPTLRIEGMTIAGR